MVRTATAQTTTLPHSGIVHLPVARVLVESLFASPSASGQVIQPRAKSEYLFM